VATTHKWSWVGTKRQRCEKCKAIRSEDNSGSGEWHYCQVYGSPTTRDPGCFPVLPGVLGAANVDGER
jgi:hypothetical protein